MSISANSSVELPTKEDFSATWKNLQVNHQSVDGSDDILKKCDAKSVYKTPENTTALYPTCDEPLESENDGLEDELARQFAAQEQARFARNGSASKSCKMLKMH